jgi:hypothetical protein
VADKAKEVEKEKQIVAEALKNASSTNGEKEKSLVEQVAAKDNELKVRNVFYPMSALVYVSVRLSRTRLRRRTQS